MELNSCKALFYFIFLNKQINVWLSHNPTWQTEKGNAPDEQVKLRLPPQWQYLEWSTTPRQECTSHCNCRKHKTCRQVWYACTCIYWEIFTLHGQRRGKNTQRTLPSKLNSVRTYMTLKCYNKMCNSHYIEHAAIYQRKRSWLNVCQCRGLLGKTSPTFLPTSCLQQEVKQIRISI